MEHLPGPVTLFYPAVGVQPTSYKNELAGIGLDLMNKIKKVIIMQKTILVIGATGMLGEPVGRRLKEDNFQVRVMTRDINKARKTFDKAFEIVVGDVTDTTSLEKALDVLSISEMGHFQNRILLHNQVALTSSLRSWL